MGLNLFLSYTVLQDTSGQTTFITLESIAKALTKFSLNFGTSLIPKRDGHSEVGFQQ